MKTFKVLFCETYYLFIISNYHPIQYSGNKIYSIEDIILSFDADTYEHQKSKIKV